MRYCIAAVVALLAILPLAAQFSERIDVAVHELEVIVETRNGKPVTDLKRDDFIVIEDGVPKTITNFSVIHETGATAVSAENAGAPEAPAARETVAPAHTTRRFVFFIDEFEMHDSTRDDLVRRMSELVGDMDQGDEAMVVTPALPKRIPLYFTSDKEVLMQTLERVTGEMMRKGPVPALGTAEMGGGGMLGRGDCAQSLRQCVERRLENLQTVCRALTDVPGRKVLILMTTIMTSTPDLDLRMPVDAGQIAPNDPAGGGGRIVRANPAAVRGSPAIVSDFRDVRSVVQKTAVIAAQSNVTIYGLEAYETGYAALPGVTVDGLGGGRADGQNIFGHADNEAENSPIALKKTTERGQEGTQDLLFTLATVTGAKAFSGTSESPKLFDQISSDLGSYYSLAYRDEAAKTTDHFIQVKIRNRPDLIVRTRTMVRTRTHDDEERGLAMAAAFSSAPSNALRIHAAVMPSARHGRMVEVPVHVQIPLSRLAFVRNADARHAQFRVLVAAIDEHGDFADAQVEHAQEVVVPDEKWDEAQSEHFAYDTTLRLRPGRYRLAVGVTDVQSGDAGFQTVEMTAE
jgi:VWFA-related protein